MQVRRIETVMDTGVVRTKGKGKRVKQLEDDFTVPDRELPSYFDDSNDPEVFYGFSDSECELEPQDEERSYHWELDSDMEQYFNSGSDESTFEGFDMNERCVCVCVCVCVCGCGCGWVWVWVSGWVGVLLGN